MFEDYAAEFEAMLPTLQRRAGAAFRAIRNPEDKAEAHANCVALAWRSWRALAARGENPIYYADALWKWAIKGTLAGRHLGAVEPSEDVLSPRAQYLHGFSVCQLGYPGEDNGTSPAEIVRDKRHPDPAGEAIAQVDWDQWRAQLPRFHRCVLGFVLDGFANMTIAAIVRRRSQTVIDARHELAASWQAYCQGAE